MTIGPVPKLIRWRAGLAKTRMAGPAACATGLQARHPGQNVGSFLRKLWWLIHKDLMREFRTRAIWPSMLLLGLAIVLTMDLQMDLPLPWKHQVAGAMLWLGIFFAGTLTLERSLAGERDQGCWDALQMYPISPASVFLAKVAFNFITLLCVSSVLISVFALVSDAPLLNRPVATLLVTAVTNLGLAAVGTLISGITNALGRQANLLVLLLLPLAIPVLLGASSATVSLIAGDVGQVFWRWLQLLAAFAFVFVTLGILAFEHVMEG